MARRAQLWQPQSVDLGAWFGNGASLFANTGAGVQYSFSPAANDEILAQVSLSWAGIPYDGASLRLVLFWQAFSTAPTAGDNVIWETDYAFVASGGVEDAFTAVDGTLSDTLDISARTADRLYKDVLSTMAGQAGADILNVTLRRKSSGAGADVFANSADVYCIALERI